jgi:hypothetical protein
MQHKPLSILIVEDEPGDQALVVTYLRHKSFRHAAGAPNLVWAKSLHGREGEFRHEVCVLFTRESAFPGGGR